MITKIYKLFRAGLVCCCATAALTACSPEEFDGPNQAGIPSISNVDINMIVDQTVNQATFTVANMPAQTYAIWTVNGTQYSTLNPMYWANNKAGTYDVELRLGNRNGFSQGSISKTFTFENSQIDLTPYINRISRTWRINYAEAGHMGCGEPGTDGSNWWSAAPNDKADWGVYDDRLTFNAEGGYTYDPGDGGTVYVNNGASIFPEYNVLTGDDGNPIDFTAPVETQTASYHFDVDGDKIVLKLSPKTLFPYLSSDDQYNNPIFTVTKLTNSEMVLLYEGNGITWRFMFTSKEDTDAPFGGFKANSEYNMWKKASFTNDFYYAHGDSWEQNPQPIGFEIVSENKYKITLPCESNMQWQAQVKFFTDMSSSAANNYDFSAIFTPTNDIKGATVKLVLHGGGDNDNVYYFADRIDLEAGDSYVFWKSDMPGIDMDKVDLVLDFGSAPAGTEVEVKNVVFKNHADDDGTVLPTDNPGGGGEEAKADWDATSGANLWKAVEDGSAFISVTPWFADGGWSQIGDPAWDHKDGVWTLTIPEGMGGSQWQGQFPINTKLTASLDKTYNFYLVLEADQDCNGVTIKLTETDDADGTKHDDNFFFADRHDIKAGEPFVYKAKGVTLPKNDAHALSLFFDFGGSPIGTNIKISMIYFEEVAAPMAYDDANNLWKGVDEGSAFISVTPWFADGGWSQIGNPEWSHEGNKWSLTIPEGMGGSQWQGQFPINTTLSAAQNALVDFSVTILTDQDCNGVTIKLTETDDADGTKHDDNFYFADRHNIPAGEPFVYVVKGATLPKNDAHALSLFFDFGGSPIGTNIVISDIIFEKAE